MWHRAFRAWGHWTVRRTLRQGLDGVHVRGADAVSRLAATQPIVFAANHVSWWDGLVVVALGEALGVEQRVLMHAHRLEDYPWFAAFGAVGLDTRSGPGARRGLTELAWWLDKPRRAGWIFPQGQQRPAHARPLGLQRGITFLARHADVPVVPVALSYVFGERRVPAAHIDFGTPLASGGDLLGELERALVAGLDRIDAGEGFAIAVPPRPAPSEHGARALGWLWRQTQGRSPSAPW